MTARFFDKIGKYLYFFLDVSLFSGDIKNKLEFVIFHSFGMFYRTIISSGGHWYGRQF